MTIIVLRQKYTPRTPAVVTAKRSTVEYVRMPCFIYSLFTVVWKAIGNAFLQPVSRCTFLGTVFALDNVHSQPAKLWPGTHTCFIQLFILRIDSERYYQAFNSGAWAISNYSALQNTEIRGAVTMWILVRHLLVLFTDLARQYIAISGTQWE